ncbi:MAG: hypothetical protein IJ796_10705 [Lachnospiraceae bacterium]|nr:hypothetical protein [Lachnospiraceae bacterium]
MLDMDLLTLQSKERFRKVMITDIAVSKVPKIKYKGLTEEQNVALYEFAQIVLLRSKTENNSNEVSITVDLDELSGKQGFQKGDEHEVLIGLDPDSYHLIRTGNNVAIIHNHPSTQTLSLQDVNLFLSNISVRLIVVVSNQGTVHYLWKDKNYSFSVAKELYNSCVEDLTSSSSVSESYAASLDFLTHCTEAGLYYQ